MKPEVYEVQPSGVEMQVSKVSEPTKREGDENVEITPPTYKWEPVGPLGWGC